MHPMPNRNQNHKLFYQAALLITNHVKQAKMFGTLIKENIFEKVNFEEKKISRQQKHAI